MARGTGECKLCALSHSYAAALLVSALSLGNPCVLSGVSLALRGPQFIELPLFGDASAPLAAGAVPCRLVTKHRRDTSHATTRPTFPTVTRKLSERGRA